jgi:membrane protein involved in colicin uptake
MELIELGSEEFDSTYTKMTDYPVEKAAKLYAEYAAQLGGTKEAMLALADIIPLNSKEIEMATTKKTATAETKVAKTVAAKDAKVKAKPAAKTATKPAAKPAAKAAVVKVPAKAAAAKPAVKAAKASTGDKPQSAADMFRSLIVEAAAAKEGKGLSDDEIFAKVQKAHSLDDNKRRYVSFYRFDAKRKGLIK